MMVEELVKFLLNVHPKAIVKSYDTDLSEFVDVVSIGLGEHGEVLLSTDPYRISSDA